MEPRPHEWEQTVRRLVEKRTWVMDGDYGGTLDLWLDAADAVIFLDLPRSLCLRRVISRRLKYAGRNRPDMTPGCPERFGGWGDAPPAVRTLVPRSPEEIRRFPAALETPAAGNR